MQKLYHLVPDNMIGDTLYPLNELKEVHPDVYEQQKDKYVGREFVMNREIPYLNCLWNDVLHLTAVHPKEIKKALGSDKVFSAFVVDPYQLDPDRTVVYLYQEKGKDLPKSDFKPYNPNEVDRYAGLPQETEDYYEKMQQADKQPLLFVRIPHILYQGSLDTSDLNIVKA